MTATSIDNPREFWRNGWLYEDIEYFYGAMPGRVRGEHFKRMARKMEQTKRTQPWSFADEDLAAQYDYLGRVMPPTMRVGHATADIVGGAVLAGLHARQARVATEDSA